MRINSKYGIRLNQSGDYASVFSRQAIIKKPIFRHLTIKGTYSATQDANFASAVAPTTSELIGYGVELPWLKSLERRLRIAKSALVA